MGYYEGQQERAKELLNEVEAPSSRLGMFVDFEQLQAAILFELGGTRSFSQEPCQRTITRSFPV